MITRYLIVIRTIFIILFVNVNAILCQYDTTIHNGKRTTYGSVPTKTDIPLIEKEWEKGNSEAGAELSFALALGAGVDLNLESAIERSTSLLSHGAARAHTTFGLLLSHNLTQTDLDKNERENKSMEHYIIAASLGDPLAQMIVGENYFNADDCPLAVNYFRKISSFTIQNTMEMELSKPDHVRHIWEEDNVIPIEAFPSQEKLDFLEYLASSEPDAALKAASILLSDVNNIEKDLPKAQEYLRMAVKANSTTAMIWLAQTFLRNVIDGDDVEALNLLEKALEYGDILAHSGIGKFYMEGRAGIKQNFTKAEYHFKKGIESGNVDAFYQLGKLYMMKDGPGTEEDAAQLWLLPATLGHVHAAWSLAEYYRENYLESSYKTLFSSYTTAMVPKMCDIALFLYRTVAQAGEYLNLFDDAFQDYYAGRKGAALMKYLLLSDLGYSAGHINAARILDEGTNSIYNSYFASSERAFELWSRAADSGVSTGNVRVGDYYYYGMAGKLMNLTAAVHHYTKAFSLGDPEGGFSLAHATEWGEGTDQDMVKAENLYTDVIDKFPEAVVPATLVLMRLKLFTFIKKYFNINLYYYFAWSISNMLDYSVSIVILSWDYLLMLLILIFITAKLTFTGR